jgi:hypothetical protein
MLHAGATLALLKELDQEQGPPAPEPIMSAIDM